MTSFPRGSMTLTATRRCSPAGKRQGGRATEVFKTLRVDDALQGAGNFAPGFLVGKKGLGDAEGPAVVVGVNEPRRHPVAPFGGHHVVDGIVDINALHRDDVLVVLRHLIFVRGSPNTVKS